ncbi:signal peptidase I [Viridibacillus sp. YIM B01967]|uniref:Signal peptidase I n=1 Tax=Viridibacillus soli TaxID=2798301 RepID=A0ABS1H7B0_9BACL|nr:signal peptidase I [Viridibacillus soli]MBK3495285.1 signal peptidase I [Viridibacillus soli]
MTKIKTEKNDLWEWIKALVVAFGLAFIIRFFLFTPIVVDGESMMPTLENGERMIVSKIGEPDRFDIVVFHATEDKDYIKRVIGLPGDHIAYKDDQLFINGKAHNEPYLDKFKSSLKDLGTLTEDFTLEELTQMSVIPEGFVFVMGDNRRNSTDSRIIGLVSMDEIVGNTKLTIWPIEDMGFKEKYK